jgi:hypothetical protein
VVIDFIVTMLPISLIFTNEDAEESKDQRNTSFSMWLPHHGYFCDKDVFSLRHGLPDL